MQCIDAEQIRLKSHFSKFKHLSWEKWKGGEMKKEAGDAAVAVCDTYSYPAWILCLKNETKTKPHPLQQRCRPFY